MGTCCPNTRQVLSGVLGTIGYDSQIDAMQGGRAELRVRGEFGGM